MGAAIVAVLVSKHSACKEWLFGLLVVLLAELLAVDERYISRSDAVAIRRTTRRPTRRPSRRTLKDPPKGELVRLTIGWMAVTHGSKSIMFSAVVCMYSSSG